MRIRIAIGLGLLFLVVLFMLQNTEVVPITFLFWQFPLSRALLIFTLLGVGIIIGWVLHGVARRDGR
ncbi:MAG: LapA family protein [Gammaproteobacteria bacterium]|nr:LapA family protein [Gammaproteobacteria bacterium]